MKEYSV